MRHHRAYIAGVKFRPGAREHLEGLGEDAAFELELEPGNRFDPNAVKVLSDGVHVGYVPADLAPEIGALIKAGRLASVTRRGSTGIDIHYLEEAA